MIITRFFFFLISDLSTKVVATIDDYKRADRSKSTGNRERFSDYLVRKGVLSETMMKQLQNEFLGESTDSHNEYNIDNRHKPSTSSTKRNKRRK